MTQQPKPTVAVTGATGTIGRHLIRQLVAQNCQVRILTRRPEIGVIPNVHVILGDLTDIQALKALVRGVDKVINCAGEIRNTSNMRAINAEAAFLLMQVAIDFDVKVFCHISSAGVVGSPNVFEIDESIDCRPTNTYEESKWQAEKGLLDLIRGTDLKLWILRPTNVIDSKNPGVMAPILQTGLTSKFHLLLKGGERAHIIHAADVAAAAIYVITSFNCPQGIYFVACDEDERNRFSDLHAIYYHLSCRKGIFKNFYLPPFISHLIRKARFGHGLHPDARFSSKKLLETGFKFSLGVEGAIREIALRPSKVRNENITC